MHTWNAPLLSWSLKSTLHTHTHTHTHAHTHIHRLMGLSAYILAADASSRATMALAVAIPTHMSVMGFLTAETGLMSRQIVVCHIASWQTLMQSWLHPNHTCKAVLMSVMLVYTWFSEELLNLAAALYVLLHFKHNLCFSLPHPHFYPFSFPHFYPLPSFPTENRQCQVLKKIACPLGDTCAGRCDGIEECPGAEDEECPRCDPGFLLCMTEERNYGCVDHAFLCDGMDDCIGGEDEIGCKLTTYLCVFGMGKNVLCHGMGGFLM